MARIARAARGLAGCARGCVAARPRRRSGASANSCPAPERPQLVHSDPAIARARSQPPTPCTTAHRVGWRGHLPMRHRPRAGQRVRRCSCARPPQECRPRARSQRAAASVRRRCRSRPAPVDMLQPTPACALFARLPVRASDGETFFATKAKALVRPSHTRSARDAQSELLAASLAQRDETHAARPRPASGRRPST